MVVDALADLLGGGEERGTVLCDLAGERERDAAPVVVGGPGGDVAADRLRLGPSDGLVRPPLDVGESEQLQGAARGAPRRGQRLVRRARPADGRRVVRLGGVDSLEPELCAPARVDPRAQVGRPEGVLVVGVEAERITVRSGADDAGMSLDERLGHSRHFRAFANPFGSLPDLG